MDAPSSQPAPVIANNDRVQISQNGRIALIDPTVKNPHFPTSYRKGIRWSADYVSRA